MTKLHARGDTAGPVVGNKSSSIQLGIGKLPGKSALLIMDTKTDDGLEAPRNSLEITAEPSELLMKNGFSCDDIPFAVEYPMVTHAQRETHSDTPVRPHNFPKHKSPGVIARLMGLDTLPEVSKTPFQPVEPRVREVEGVSSVHHRRSNSQDSLQMEVLSFRDHPQEKQLQEFKKTFEAQQAFQVKARLLSLEFLATHKPLDVKWREAHAELDKSKEIPDTFYFLQSNENSSFKLLEESQIPYSKTLSNYQLDKDKTIRMKLMEKTHHEKGNDDMLEIKKNNFTAKTFSRQFLIDSKASSLDEKSPLEIRQTAAKTRPDCHFDSSKLASTTSTNMQATHASPEKYHKQSFALRAIEQKYNSSSSTRMQLVLKPDASNHHLRGVSSPRFRGTTRPDEISEMRRCAGRLNAVDDVYESKRRDERLDTVKSSKRASKTKTMAAQKEPRVIAKEIAPRFRDAVTRKLSKSSPSRIDSIPEAYNVKTFKLARINNDVDGDAARTSRVVTAPSARKFVKESPSIGSSTLPCSPRQSKLAEDNRKDIKALTLSEESKLRAPTRSETNENNFPAQGKRSISHSNRNSRTKSVVKRPDDILNRERSIEDVRLPSRSSKPFDRDFLIEAQRATNSPITFTRSRSLPSSATKCTESLHDNKLHSKASSRMADWPCTISDTKTSERGNSLSLKKEASRASYNEKFAGMRFSKSMSNGTVTKTETYQNKQTFPYKTSVQNNMADCFEPLADNCSKFEGPNGKYSPDSSLSDDNLNVDSGICFTSFVNESCSTNSSQGLAELMQQSTQSESSLNVEDTYVNEGKKFGQNDDSLDHQFKRAPEILSLDDSCDAPESGIDKFEQRSPVSVLESPFFEKVQRSIPELQELCLRAPVLDEDESTVITPACKDSTNSVLPNRHTTDSKEQAPSCLNNHDYERSDQGKIWVDEVSCPPGKEKHMEYVQKIIHSRCLLMFPEVWVKSWSPRHPLDHFGKIGDLQHQELESSLQQLDQNVQHKHAQTAINHSAHSSEHSNLNILDLRLLVDVVDECLEEKLRSSSWIWPKTLAITSRSVQTGKKLMQDTWAEVRSYLFLSCLDSQENFYRLSNIDLEKRSGWIEVDEEVAKICHKLEQQILKDLIRETVFNLLAYKGYYNSRSFRKEEV